MRDTFEALKRSTQNAEIDACFVTVYLHDDVARAFPVYVECTFFKYPDRFLKGQSLDVGSYVSVSH